MLKLIAIVVAIVFSILILAKIYSNQMWKLAAQCLTDNISISLSGLFWKKCKTIKKGLVFEHKFSMLPEFVVHRKEII